MSIVRTFIAFVAGLFVMSLAAGVSPGFETAPAEANHHFMRIDRVMSNGNVQYIQLRMHLAGQNFVSGKQLCFFNAAGQATGSFTIPANVTNNAIHSAILIGTAEFDAAWAGGSPDFTFSGHPIPASGKIEYRDICNVYQPWDAVAYGANYTGSAAYGSPFPQSLPQDNVALRLVNNINGAANTRNNSTDYALGTADFKNNAGVSGSLSSSWTPPPTPTPGPTPTPTPTPSPPPPATPTPLQTPTPTAGPTSPPTATPLPTTPATASPPPTTAPPTPTPTAAPTATATPKPPSFSPPAGGTATPLTYDAFWGDNNCSGPPPNPVDALLVLRFDGGMGVDTGNCPDMGAIVTMDGGGSRIWADVDCSGQLPDPLDALKLLRFDGGLPASQGPGCPALGSEITVAQAQ